MEIKLDLSNQENSLLLSDRGSSSKDYSCTEGSFFNEEDQNLMENKELFNKQNIINGSVSFTNKFEFIKKSNFIYKFYINNTSLILIMNILSLIFFLLIICIKILFLFILKPADINNKFMLYIIFLFLPFILLTLIKNIVLYNESKVMDKESENNKDLMRLLVQKWNIYYSISIFLLSLNLIFKLLLVDIIGFRYKIIFVIEILIIIFSLILLVMIYYFTKSSNNNIIIIKTIDIISFPLSISVLLSFVIINFVDQIKNLIYINSIYCFLLSCISLLVMVYYNDILFSFVILIYQMGGINEISFYNMNFHLFCTLINLGFIIFMSIKNIRKGFLCANDENSYTLIDEQFHYNTEEETNE